MANAIEQIYNQLNQVFGGANPNQFFCLLMPGTNLDAASYAYDTSTSKPATVQESESRLVDQMFDIAIVTGSSNGQRVSSQFVQALSVLTPRFDPMLPIMKKTLRDFLNTPMPANTILNDKLFTGSLGEYYFKLYEAWIATKLDWSRMILAKKSELAIDPRTEKEKFLEWYDEIAEGELAKIDEAMGKVLSVFSPSDMESILGALSSGPGGEVNEAMNVVNNIRLASPDGGFFYPVNLTPDNWFLDLASDLNPTNLLNDPAFIGATLNARRQAVLASVSQVQALMNKMPSQSQLDSAKDAFSKAQSTYTNAQNALLNTYADNTAIAADIYLSKHQNQSPSSDADKTAALAELNQSAADASKAKGDSPVDTSAKKKNGSVITPDDVKQILDGQKKLIDSQSGLLTSSQALADAGMNLANEEAASFSDAPMILARLKSQLGDIQTLQDQLTSSIAAAAANPPAPTLRSVLSAADTTMLNNAKAAGDNAMASKTSTPTADAVGTAILGAINLTSNPNLQPVHDAVSTAKQAAGATPQSVVSAFNTAFDDVTHAPVAKKSFSSDRFMDIQMSFNTSDMSRDSSSSSSFTQTSWSVDLFFGSASGQSSTSQASSTENDLDSSKEIQIGMKVTKVDISRGWFDPGVFKITDDMNRITNTPVSLGSVDPNNPMKNSVNANTAILPCFPVSFVIAKDINITFQANSSSLDAIHSVIDQKSAAGGGFLCFSVSSSSSSHNESSSLHTKTTGQVVNITIPGPQILGWFLEFTPNDNSTYLGQNGGTDSALTIIDYIAKLEQLGATASKPTNGALSPAALKDLITVGNGAN